MSKVDDVEKFFHRHTRKSADRLWPGYAAALVIILGRLVDMILLSNPLVEDDFTLSRAYEGNVPFQRMPADSPLGKLVRKIVSLYKPLLSPFKSHNQLSLSLQRIRDSFLTPLRDAFRESVDIEPKIHQDLAVNAEQCLKRLGLVNTHMFLCDLQQVENIFHSTYRRSRGSRWSRIPRDLYPGYKLTIAYLLDRLAEAGLSRHSITSLLKTGSWQGLDRNYRRVQHELIDPIERDIGIDYALSLLKVRPVSETTRRRLLRCSFTLPSPALAKEEEVRKTLLWYPTKLVGSEGITWPGVIGVITLLEGVMAYQKGETTRVVRFDHPGPNGNDYSFAVLVPSFSNYSEWWVFPNFCNDHSGTGGSGFRELSAYLKSVRSRLGERRLFNGCKWRKNSSSN